MRNVGLDSLRLIACILVLGRHLHLDKFATHESTKNAILQTWVRGGWIGVDLFFVLSGFLISTLLFREYSCERKLDIKRFLIRRGLKLYPAFWVFLAFSLTVLYFKGEWPKSRSIVGELLFLQNYKGGIWNHTWSLAVEEHFYLGLAFVCAFLAGQQNRLSKWLFSDKQPFAIVPYSFLAIAVVCLALRIQNSASHEKYQHFTHLFATHLRIDSLSFGVLLAYLVRYQSLQQRLAAIPSTLLIACGAGLLAPAFVFQVEKTPWVSVYGVIGFFLGSGLILLAATRLEESSSRLVMWCGHLGAASYSIYLWHMPVNNWLWPEISSFLGMRGLAAYVVVYLLGSVAIGTLMHRLIEAPVLVIRDRFYPSRISSNRSTEQVRSAVQVGVSDVRESSTKRAA